MYINLTKQDIYSKLSKLCLFVFLYWQPESTADFVVWQTGNWIALTIPNVRPDLTGTYKLRVVTPSGEYYTTGDLSVNGQKLQTKPYIPS